MNEKAPPQANDAILQAQAERARLARAFAEVFGTGRSRSESQSLVLAHLEKDASDDSNAFSFTGATDGIGTALAAAFKDGAQSRIRIINRQLKASEQETFQKIKPKPTTTR